MLSFDELYNNKIKNQIQSLESQRLKLYILKKKRLKVFNVIILILSALVAIYLWSIFDSFWVFFGLILTVIIALVLLQKEIASFILKNNGLLDFESLYKDKVVRPIISSIDDQWKYDHSASLPLSDLTASFLFNISSNTKVKSDDLITGKWHGQDLLIANIQTTSVSSKSDNGNSSISNQSFSGLMVRLQTEIKDTAFLIPKAKTSSAANGLTNIKFARDPNMTYEEQKAHNLKAMGESFGGYTWSPSLFPEGNNLNSMDIEGYEMKNYQLYTSNDQFRDDLLNNKQLNALLSSHFVAKEATDLLTQHKNFQIFDKEAMDDLVSTTLTYAIHSGFIWVLIPAYADKFELNLDNNITQETVKRHYNDLNLALLSISPFIKTDV